jgi:peptidoglycan/xylan/chitin deacetylase (PgdA/CDA1 family)
MRLALLALFVAVLGATGADAKVGYGTEPAADAGGSGKHKHRAWPLPAAGPTASGDPELIFTFDDGPNPKTTPAVLDALAKHHIHAVFFMVGEMAANKQAADLIARIVREGHIIGNHTMTHQDLCRTKLDDDHAAHEIDDAKQTIERVSGLEMAWFRTPYGVRCERVENLLAERHLGHFHWDLDPQEWKHGSAKKAIDYVEKQVGKMTGRNVLLMHDIKKATVEAIPVILDWIDDENARRAELHKRRIRIIQSYELAAERLPAGLVAWLGDAAPSPGAWSATLASLLP